ncbi:MAG: hypothetical protein LUH18_05965 [Oscillospiraceae bacterium]|nr:hypothetical protein [Oscillospiraceae bacterium]
MRKLLALVLVALLAISLLIGCDSNAGNGGSNAGTQVEEEDDSITTETDYDSLGHRIVYTYTDGVLTKETHYDSDDYIDYWYVYEYTNGKLTAKKLYEPITGLKLK